MVPLLSTITKYITKVKMFGQQLSVVNKEYTTKLSLSSTHCCCNLPAVLRVCAKYGKSRMGNRKPMT